jgi:hypothetical protein
VIDFVDNYDFEIQKKIQSMHLHSYQVTILVHITWQQNPNPNPHDEDLEVLMNYHFYINDDKSHDNYFIQHCMLSHWQSMVDNNF